jgi:hypothetical protein
VPSFDAPHVALLKRAGAVVIGKTNIPEFGAGSQTFNPVFGATRNPYDTRLTPCARACASRPWPPGHHGACPPAARPATSVPSLTDRAGGANHCRLV